MRFVGLLLVMCLCGTPLQAQAPQDWIDPVPPCDSQNSAHREAVKRVLAAYDAILKLERGFTSWSDIELLAEIEQINLYYFDSVCAEEYSLSLTAIAKLLAIVYEQSNIQLEIGNSDDLAPLLEKWRAWATAFVNAELKTQFWLGSFSNYQGRGLEVGCASYLLPVDTGLARGRNTLTELSLALSALFDPEQKHPDAAVETKDWIKKLGLSVAGIHIDEGFAEITLGGQLRGIGTCGDAILEAQILQTVFQFSDIKRARITDGDMNLMQIVELSDRLSQEELRVYVYDREDLDWLRE